MFTTLQKILPALMLQSIANMAEIRKWIEAKGQ
jgi:hypothetical protein